MVSMPIVVGTDGSEQAGRAVEWAACEAVRRGAALRIVSVPAMPSRLRPSGPVKWPRGCPLKPSC